MESIMEHYGVGLLQLLGGAGVLALVGTLLQPGGCIQVWIGQYLYEIAG